MYICYIAQDHTRTIDSTLLEQVSRFARWSEKVFVCMITDKGSSILPGMPRHVEVVYVKKHRLSFITARRVKKACASCIEGAREYVSIIADDVEYTGMHARFLALAHDTDYNIFAESELSCVGRSRRKVARVLSEARMIVVPSMRVKKSCDECVGKDMSASIAIVSPFVEVKDCTEREPERYTEAGAAFFLHTEGMHIEDVHTALKAFAPVARRYPNILLAVSGCARIRQETEHFIHAELLERNIICHPFLEGNEMCAYLSYADLMLYTPKKAGYGTALVCALLSGVPALTTDVGVVGSLITTDDALICPPGDVACLTKRMLLLLDNPAILASLKESAQRMKEKFPRTVSERDRYDLKMRDILE